MESKRKIRSRYRQGQPIREIERETGISRNTIKKYIHAKTLDDSEYKRGIQPHRALGGYIEALEKILRDSRQQKRERKAIFIYNELCMQGYIGSYSAVGRYVSKWRCDNKVQSKSGAYIPLAFRPGEAYQFDWNSETILLNGILTKIKAAQMVLCYSGKKFVYAYPCETQEMVFDAHVRAFAYYGGTPSRGIYDNMKTAVKKILKGKDREWNPAFEKLCAHYMIEPDACNAASPWEKGKVERQVQTVHDGFFTPMPEVRSLEELNDRLMSWLVVHNAKHKHPTYKDKTIDDLFVKEQACLVKVPMDFDGYKERDVRVSMTCLAMVDRNRYSVSSIYAGKIVQCRLYADRLVFIRDGKEIGRHIRQFTIGQSVFEYRHYLPIVEHKPGAMQNGAPFMEMSLPDAMASVHSHLINMRRDKEFAHILAQIQHESIEAVENACQQAIDASTISSDIILNLILRGKQEPEITQPLQLPAHLILQHTQLPDCSRYDALLTGVI